MSLSRATIFAVIAVLSAVSLSACGSAPQKKVQKSEAELYPARPTDYPVHGIDISRHQGAVDWASIRNDGTRFAFIKATEGGDHADENFMAHWIAARDAGVKRGAYHFYYWCRNVEDQISWFIRNVPVEPDALPPVLDVEWNGDSKTCPKKVPQAEALAAMKRFLRAIEAHYHKRPIIYTSIDFYREIIDGHLHDYPLWVRTVRAHPVARYANRPWTFWQYTEKGQVSGVNGPVDRNAFVGTEEEWNRFIHQQVMVASNTSALQINQQLALAFPPAQGPTGQGPLYGVMVASNENALSQVSASQVSALAPPTSPVTQGFAPPAAVMAASQTLGVTPVYSVANFPSRIPLPPVRRKVFAQN